MQINDDLNKALDFAFDLYGIERVPTPHATVLYGMEHLSEEQAIEKLKELSRLAWPPLPPPKGVRCDRAHAGRPGQVADVAWAELSFETTPRHEQLVDEVHRRFGMEREGTWTPHISLAYDNLSQSSLRMADFVGYVMTHPSLLQSRPIKGLALWRTEGEMADWRCLERISFE